MALRVSRSVRRCAVGPRPSWVTVEVARFGTGGARWIAVTGPEGMGADADHVEQSHQLIDHWPSSSACWSRSPRRRRSPSGRRGRQPVPAGVLDGFVGLGRGARQPVCGVFGPLTAEKRLPGQQGRIPTSEPRPGWTDEVIMVLSRPRDGRSKGCVGFTRGTPRRHGVQRARAFSHSRMCSREVRFQP